MWADEARPQARRHYPGVPVITTGDMQSEESRAVRSRVSLTYSGALAQSDCARPPQFWAAETIYRRMDREGIPLIFSGWPCDGHSAQNAGGSALECGTSHPSTGLLCEIWRITRHALMYLNTPRIDSTAVMRRRIRASCKP